ncbi:hypothetical protein F5Y15DRAFT_26645 [Xylariaceae sp. FL0016]|nr:hypothetical protein F5Y15DRAFT_26645 [Xylariaceae sp. FL0016]
MATATAQKQCSSPVPPWLACFILTTLALVYPPYFIASRGARLVKKTASSLRRALQRAGLRRRTKRGRSPPVPSKSLLDSTTSSLHSAAEDVVLAPAAGKKNHLQNRDAVPRPLSGLL